MFLNTIDKKIRQAFSNAAVQYDVISSLHKEIGRELIQRISTDIDPQVIVDIGMGTGWLTKRLKWYFQEAQIIGLDFAPGMIEMAKQQNEGFTIVEANAAHLPFKKNSVDVIVSNLSYQWVLNLKDAFRSCHASLNKNGRIYMTVFGRETFHELFEALNHGLLSEKAKTPKSFQRLASQDYIAQALAEAGFKEFKCDHERIQVRFTDMMEILKWIKSIGANVLNPQKDFYLGKDVLSAANKYYEEHFCDRLGIYTTFEVIWIEATKNG